jgi:hypothetical protein
MIINYHGHPMQVLIKHNTLLINGVEVNTPPVMNLHDQNIIVLQATGEVMVDKYKNYLSDFIEHQLIKALLG